MEELVPVVEIRTLGPFEVRRDGQAIAGPTAWGSHRARAVLKQLVHRRYRFVPREALIEAVWPHLDPDKATVSLKVAVSDLRRILEPGLVRGEQSAFVATEGDGYRLVRSEPLRLDLDHFEAALDRQRWLGDGSAQIVGALDLYGGDYMAEDPYEDWPLEMRSRLRERFMDAYERHAFAHLGRQDPAEVERAIAHFRRLVALDPLRERSHAGLIESYGKLGRRSSAQRTFALLRERLQDELGVEPLPETAAALREALAGDDRLAALGVGASQELEMDPTSAPAGELVAGLGSAVDKHARPGRDLALPVSGDLVAPEQAPPSARGWRTTFATPLAQRVAASAWFVGGILAVVATIHGPFGFTPRSHTELAGILGTVEHLTYVVLFLVAGSALILGYLGLGAALSRATPEYATPATMLAVCGIGLGTCAVAIVQPAVILTAAQQTGQGEVIAQVGLTAQEFAMAATAALVIAGHACLFRALGRFPRWPLKRLSRAVIAFNIGLGMVLVPVAFLVPAWQEPAGLLMTLAYGALMVNGVSMTLAPGELPVPVPIPRRASADVVRPAASPIDRTNRSPLDAPDAAAAGSSRG